MASCVNASFMSFALSISWQNVVSPKPPNNEGAGKF